MTAALPKKRIEVIDALRGFALLTIFTIHCMEHFECYVYPESSSAALQWMNGTAHHVVFFLFAGKSYAIFSLLFGLSFFIQMESQAEKGKDFRPRFAWRMAILWVFGFFNAWLYFGEIFEAYAVIGLLLIPLCKLPERWLKTLAAVLIFQLPNLIGFIAALLNPDLGTYPLQRFDTLLESDAFGDPTAVYRDGSLTEVLKYNFWSGGRTLKWTWFVATSRMTHILGLFLVGLLIGRAGIHKDEGKMIRWSKKALAFGFAVFPVFYCLCHLLPELLPDNPVAVRVGWRTFQYYYELGQMFIIVGLFVLAYFCLGARKTLDKIAPVGRMSVTNYMVQTVVGTFVFYGYGLGMAEKTGFFTAGLIGLGLCTLQALYSYYWMKKYYYGPMEWLWRALTWMSFRNIALKRTVPTDKKHNI